MKTRIQNALLCQQHKWLNDSMVKHAGGGHKMQRQEEVQCFPKHNFIPSTFKNYSVCNSVLYCLTFRDHRLGVSYLWWLWCWRKGTRKGKITNELSTDTALEIYKWFAHRESIPTKQKEVIQNIQKSMTQSYIQFVTQFFSF